jgi:NAD(P)H-flavin reductase
VLCRAMQVSRSGFYKWQKRVNNPSQKVLQRYKDVAWLNYTEHYAACECGQDGTFGHVIDGNNYLLPGRHYQCLVCGGPANLGFVFGAKNNDNITVCTENGSYCLPNGILVLVGDDVEAFQNGTLGFIEDYYRHSKKEFH